MRAGPLNYFLALSRTTKRMIMLFIDSVMIIAGLWISFALRLGEFYVPSVLVTVLILLAPVLAVPVFIRFGLYRAIVRYIGFKAIWAIVQAVSLYALLWALLVALFSSVGEVPRSVLLLNWVVAIMLIGGSRMIARWMLSSASTASVDKDTRKKVVIYGAGHAGMQLATVLSYNDSYEAVAFIDDNKKLHKFHINGLRVYPFLHLGTLIEQYAIDEVLLAMPSASNSRRRDLIQLLEPYPVHVRTLPAMTDVAGGGVKVEDIREVEIEDLLGRDQVEPREDLLSANIKNKVVMVTGAGGSIGSELCRQIILQSPEKLILFEQNEYMLYKISRELENIQAQNASGGKTSVEVLSVLGSVLDKGRMESVYVGFGVETVYHAAAYKHVPMVEMNPSEAVKNNIFGTYTAAKAAIDSGIESFVLVSTDKAVRPTNTMGASKRFAELILQDLGRKASIKTRFTMVRFGNVLGSSGSVIPLFHDQIQNGGPITVTDPKIIRYFMTIPEAAQLVIQAGAMGKGEDVFVLDMGEPVKILDLAEKMIHLSGLEIKDKDNPDGDIEIVYTGLRPGEKLYEELLIGENTSSTEHPLIMRAQEDQLTSEEIESYLTNLKQACADCNQEQIRNILLEAVKEFQPQCGIKDVVYNASAKLTNASIHVLYDESND